ncbi:MAG: FtsQ-type POTRA domain-containing protein [Actinomycetaceae bacterium]|nr:FtsQ-type POTRA domain-containing protein [Actinomycetaceae bacterium]MDY6083039.1 FtsQ-type POTRA domain-containing protein [Actinomycetaceae bacterium]
MRKPPAPHARPINTHEARPVGRREAAPLPRAQQTPYAPTRRVASSQSNGSGVSVGAQTRNDPKNNAKNGKKSSTPGNAKTTRVGEVPPSSAQSHTQEAAQPAQLLAMFSSRRAPEHARPDEIDHARRQHRSAAKRKRRRIVGIVAVLLGVVGLSVLVIFFLPLFALHTDSVTVQGARTLVTPQEVRTVVSRWDSVSLARLPVSKIEQRLMSQNPAIQSVDIHRDFPHSATITVVERTPVVCVGEAGSCVGTGADAVAIPRAPTEGLPVLNVSSVQESQRQQSVRDVVHIMTLMADAKMDVSSVHVSASRQITLNLAGGRTVKWGTAQDSEKKARILGVLMSVDATVYDVSLPDAPATS